MLLAITRPGSSGSATPVSIAASGQRTEEEPQEGRRRQTLEPAAEAHAVVWIDERTA